MVRLDRRGEASAEAKEALKLDPTFTQTEWRQGSFYSDPKILDSEVARSSHCET